MRTKERIAGIVLTLIVATAVVAFLSGPLLPWSPLHPGYDATRYAKAILIAPRSDVLAPELRELSRLIEEIEGRTEMQLKTPIRLVVSGSWGLFNRGTLKDWAAMPSGAASATLPTGTVIYLSPLAHAPERNTADVFRNALTKALIYQQIPLFRLRAFAPLAWMVEGYAEHIGDADLTIHDSTWTRLAVEESHLYTVATDAPESRVPADIRASFQTESRRHFVEFLIARYGAEAFVRFRSRAIAEPEGFETAFEELFGRSLSEAEQRFKAEVQLGQWPMPEFGRSGL